MPPILKNDDGTIPLYPVGYGDEDELQAMLAQHPELLREDTDAPLRTVRREVSMEGQYLDILMVDATGMPVAVEVKLVRNADIRRKIVGQILEYASLLSSLTVDELDSIARGALNETLHAFAVEGETTFEDLRKACGTHLRAGQVRIVIAVDEAPDGLIQIFEFLSRRSDLDIRLVRLHKYFLKTGEVLVVPNLVVKPENIGPRKLVDPRFMQVILAYQDVAPEEFPIWEEGEPDWRLVCPRTWKNLWVHYEFCDWGKTIGVEIHLEDTPVKPLQDLLHSFKEDWTGKYPEWEIVWDPNWADCGRVGILFPKKTDPAVIAETMREIIGETSAEIQKQIDLLPLE